MRSVKLAFMEKVSVLPGVLVGGSFARILYLLQDSECRMRTRSSSGRLARSRISLNVNLSSAQHSPIVRGGAKSQSCCRTASVRCKGRSFLGRLAQSQTAHVVSSLPATMLSIRL